MLQNQRVQDFMTTPPVTVSAETPLGEAMRIMREQTIGSILIADGDQLEGIFTDRDAIAYYLDSETEKMREPVGKYMTPDIVSIQCREGYLAAHEKMQQHHIRHLPVCDGERLVGIISIRDLIDFISTISAPEDPPQDQAVVKEAQSPPDKELSDFQVRNVHLLTHLFQHDAMTDTAAEIIRESELDYFSLIDKCTYLEQRVNLDEKTNLLKYKKDILSGIVKTASRILIGARNEEYSISFIRFDIDDFSIFNNLYGHETGDEVLIKFATLIKETSRPTDYVIRFGGEEFDVILPGTTVTGAVSYLEKIFKKMCEIFVERKGKRVQVTVSAGVSSLSYDFLRQKYLTDDEIAAQYQQLQCEADDALYEAKCTGKDRFCIFDPKKTAQYTAMREGYKK